MVRKSTPAELGEVTVAVTPMEKFREFLATRNLRLTRERSIVVEEIFSGHEHFEAEQLIERLSQRKDGRRVSRSSIYRHLALLEEAKLLRKVARQDDRDVWEHDYGYPNHDHLICGRCGAMIEFHNEQIAAALEEVARQHGFRMSGHRLEVDGLCDACCRPPKERPAKLNLM